jgi:GNAT superfamily N-acetyltransferase
MLTDVDSQPIFLYHALMTYQIRPLTPNLWPSLVDLFSAGGPVSRCWCMYWRIGSGYRKRPPAENKADLEQVVRDGPPPGLLAFEGQRAVGWCQLTPRGALPVLEENRRLKPVDDTPVWSISCFYVRKGYRKKGVSAALIAAAVETARAAGAQALEAYPLDAALTPSSSHTGYLTTFLRAGFKEVARHVPSRPIVRYTFDRKE